MNQLSEPLRALIRRRRRRTPVTGAWYVEHKFKIGERLFVAHHVPERAYVVIKRLPKRAGEFEYQIKNIDEQDECIVRESQLRPTRVR